MNLRSLLVAAFAIGHSACTFGQGSQRLEIPDPNGHERPMTAFTVEVPAGWQANGGVFWDIRSTCTAVVPSMNWQARSPDGLQVFEILPRWASQSMSQGMAPAMPGCPVQPIESIRGYLEVLARQRHPNGRILDYRERPDLAQSVSVPDLSSLNNEMMQFRAWAEAGEIMVAWEENGRAMRETILLAGSVSETRMNMPMLGPARSVVLTTGAPVALRAPDGQLDLALATHIRASVKPDPEWGRRLQQHEARIAQDNANTARQIAQIQAKGSSDALRAQWQRGQIAASTNAEIAQMRNDSWQNQQNSQDAARRNHIHSIYETQPYHDPQSGRQVDLSNHYNHAWRLNDGTYHQTNDPSFNPYAELGIDGEPMQPIRHE